MRNTYGLIFTIGILLVIGLACEFTTANLSDVTFASSSEAAQTFTTAKLNEKIYALSAVKNTGGEHTVRWKVSDSEGKEIKLPQNETQIEGARSVYLNLTLTPRVFKPGKYTFEVTLLNKEGEKEIDKKAGVLEVTE